MKILIKEVADVTFYKIGTDCTPTYPVLYLDTLKVSTIEQTAETSEAKGGKGNATLISWDYGKEINVTLEDALFSAKSMSIMFGNGTVKDVANATESGLTDKKLIMKTESYTAKSVTKPTQGVTSIEGWEPYFISPDGKRYLKLNPKFFTAQGEEVTSVSLTLNEKYFCTYDLAISGVVIDISANSFPGTYYVTGDTYARSEVTGDDEFFQFIIPKAKVTSENTITLEAEGDPSVFNMNLKVLRPTNGQMMKLVKYELVDEVTGEDEAITSVLIHNHKLTSNNNDTSVEKASITLLESDSGKSVTLTTTVSNAQVVVNKAIATASVSGIHEITIAPVAVGTTTANVYSNTGILLAIIDITIEQE